MIVAGKEKWRQHQIRREQIMARKKNPSEQNAALFNMIDFEKGLEEDIEALYQEEEKCDRA